MSFSPTPTGLPLPRPAIALRLASGGLIPRIVLGTAHLGSPLPEGLAPSRGSTFALLDALLANGGTAIDTAASYMLGGTERLLGSWMRARHNRSRLFLITKGGHPTPLLAPNRVTPTDLAADLHASLRRLGTEYVDLYLVHRDHPKASLAPLLEALAGFQAQGKVRAYGVSNWSHLRVQALDALARAQGLPGPSVSSPHFSLAEWARVPWAGSVSIAGAANFDARAFYEDAQLPVLSYAALGGGFLAGAGGSTYDCAANRHKRQRAQALASRRGVDPSQIALAYLFGQPFPVYAVTAVSSVEHLRLNLAAADLTLDAAELRLLERGDAL